VTRSSPLAPLTGLLMAVLLAGCGGGNRPVDSAAAENQASPSSSEAGGSDSGSGASGQDASGQGQDQGKPGGPGGGADGGGGDSGGSGGGNPGAPGDVLVFEESNVPFGPFRDEGSGHQVCVVEGKCTLADPVKDSGEADPQTGLDDCLITTFDYSTGTRPNPDPSESRKVFREGATVTAHVKCDSVQPGDSGTNGTDGTGDGSDTSGDTGDQQPPADGSQG
jgi:hypothetical protein